MALVASEQRGGSKAAEERTDSPRTTYGTPRIGFLGGRGECSESNRGAPKDACKKTAQAARPLSWKVDTPILSDADIPHQRRISVRHSNQPRINFHNLETAALKRYRRFYKLPDVGPNSSKDQLVMAVGRHFMAQTVDESKVIALFVAAARRAALEPRED
ncbi:hypothetical protein WJX75_006093 [Coccomyxa subellipsoidea]|uniref:Histone deacetylase complex subunit SAP30 Sin3 binding domain-containing protein n=1 Tax=Coccomyxa subellipsoidea TaxID=248742 RepID=A0ABR2YNY6_9CHLO